MSIRGLLIFLLFNIYFASDGQIIEKKIRDVNKNLPIPYCSIVNRDKGFYADSNGHFIMPLNYFTFDTIEISSLGYEKYIITKENLKNLKGDFIFLKEKPILLNPITVSSKLNETNSKEKFKKHSVFFDLVSQINEIGRLFNAPFWEYRKLKTMSFFIKFKNGSKPLLKFNIYTFHNGKPKDQLYQIILNPKSIKNGWNTVDFSKFEYIIPQNGVFASVEYALTSFEKQDFGKEVRLTNEFAYGLSKIKYFIPAFKRINYRSFYGFLEQYQGIDNNYYIPMIKIEVE